MNKPKKANVHRPVNGLGEKPSIIVQNLVVRPVNRKAQDITAWREAMRAAEATYPRRTMLYDLYEDILLDGHLDSIIEKRIMAVTNAEWQFVKDGKVVESVNGLIDTEPFEDVVRLIMSSRFWGYAMGEIIRTPEGFAVFDIPKKHMRPHLGVVATEQTADTGINIRGGIYAKTVLEVGKAKDLGKLLKAAQYAIYKRGNFGDWAQFAELFGMPFRKGTYDGFDENQRQKLEEAMEKMGSAAYGVIPEGSNIEFIPNATGNVDGSLYELLKNACNTEMSKLILGQTMTTENGSSKSQADVHLKVEESINLADRIFVRRVLNSKFTRLLQAQGIDTQGGWFEVKGEGEEKLGKKDLADLIIKLKKDGNLPIDDDFMYEEFGIPKPANYEQLKKEMEAAKAALTDPKNAATPPARKPKAGKKPAAKDLKLVRSEPHTVESLIQRIRDFFA